MNYGEALLLGAKRLSHCSSSARLDAEVLLAHATGEQRSLLIAYPERTLKSATQAVYEALLDRRSRGEPVAYLTGHKEFYGLDLDVTPDVLVPRPETESVVDACLEALPPDETSFLADIGTGSGAIAVAVAVHRPHCRVIATDVSASALEVAGRNCRKHGVAGRVDLRLGHLFDPIDKKQNVIAANLPYVAPGEAEPDVATWEPQVAVFGGGDDGTSLIREFLSGVANHLLPGGTIIMESAYSQGRLVAKLAAAALPTSSIDIRKDLAGYDRIVVIRT